MPRPAPLDLKRLRRYSLAERPSKVTRTAFAKPTPAHSSLKGFLDGLPQILAAQKFRRLSDALALAHKRRKPVLAMLGAHVLKVGLSPLIGLLFDPAPGLGG